MNIIINTLAENIKRERNKIGISLGLLANRSGIPEKILDGIEQGICTDISIVRLVKIATALKTTIDQLLIDRLSVTVYMRGHLCYYDKDGKLRYADDDTLFDDSRPCPKCHLKPTMFGYDACLGEIQGAISVCCGHGVEDGYIIWDNKSVED